MKVIAGNSDTIAEKRPVPPPTAFEKFSTTFERNVIYNN